MDFIARRGGGWTPAPRRYIRANISGANVFAAVTAEEWTAVLLSLKVGLAGVVVSLPVALALGYVLARSRFRGKAFLDAVVHLPLVLPPVVTGYLLLVAFGRNGTLGRLLEDTFGITIAFRWTGAALASAIMGLPLMVRAIRISFEAIDPRLEVAARSLGGTAVYVFATITLPLALPGVVAGSILSFARGLGEFGATITFVSNIPGETQTIPIAIYSLLQTPGADLAVARMTALAIALSFAALLASDAVSRRLATGARAREL
jgi:molybdate transport system permease protein